MNKFLKVPMIGSALILSAGLGYANAQEMPVDMVPEVPPVADMPEVPDVTDVAQMPELPVGLQGVFDHIRARLEERGVDVEATGFGARLGTGFAEGGFELDADQIAAFQEQRAERVDAIRERIAERLAEKGITPEDIQARVEELRNRTGGDGEFPGGFGGMNGLTALLGGGLGGGLPVGGIPEAGEGTVPAMPVDLSTLLQGQQGGGLAALLGGSLGGGLPGADGAAPQLPNLLTGLLGGGLGGQLGGAVPGVDGATAQMPNLLTGLLGGGLGGQLGGAVPGVDGATAQMPNLLTGLLGGGLGGQLGGNLPTTDATSAVTSASNRVGLFQNIGRFRRQ